MNKRIPCMEAYMEADHKFLLFFFFSKRIIIHTSSYLLQLWAALSIIVSSKIILRCLCLSMDHLYFICGHVFQKRILAFFSENVSIRYGSNFDGIVNFIITIVDSLSNSNVCKLVWVFHHKKLIHKNAWSIILGDLSFDKYCCWFLDF